jgi:hypothetical protein
MYHAEPDLWLLLVVGRHLVGPHCLPSSLTGLLKGLHSLAALLHGLLSTQLEQVGVLVLGNYRVCSCCCIGPLPFNYPRHAVDHSPLRLQPLLQDVAASILQPDPFAAICPPQTAVLSLCCFVRQDPSGARVRMRLQPLLQDVAASLLQPDSAALFSLSSPLGLTGGVPLLPISTAAFTRKLQIEPGTVVQYLAGRTQLAMREP